MYAGQFDQLTDLSCSERSATVGALLAGEEDPGPEVAVDDDPADDDPGFDDAATEPVEEPTAAALEAGGGVPAMAEPLKGGPAAFVPFTPQAARNATALLRPAPRKTVRLDSRDLP